MIEIQMEHLEVKLKLHIDDLKQGFTNLIGFRDSCVLRWEGVPVETEVADPKFGSEVDLTHRVKDGSAALTAAHDWFVLDWG